MKSNIVLLFLSMALLFVVPLCYGQCGGYSTYPFYTRSYQGYTYSQRPVYYYQPAPPAYYRYQHANRHRISTHIPYGTGCSEYGCGMSHFPQGNGMQLNSYPDVSAPFDGSGTRYEPVQGSATRGEPILPQGSGIRNVPSQGSGTR